MQARDFWETPNHLMFNPQSSGYSWCLLCSLFVVLVKIEVVPEVLAVLVVRLVQVLPPGRQSQLASYPLHLYSHLSKRCHDHPVRWNITRLNSIPTRASESASILVSWQHDLVLEHTPTLLLTCLGFFFLFYLQVNRFEWKIYTQGNSSSLMILEPRRDPTADLHQHLVVFTLR